MISLFVEDINKNKDNIVKILKTVDLLPLPSIGKAHQICYYFKLKGSYQTLIGETNSSIQSIAQMLPQQKIFHLRIKNSGLW